MINLMHRIAIRLAPGRAGLVAIATAGAVVAATALFTLEPPTSDLILLPALVVLLWAVLGVVFVDVFATVPTLPDEDAGHWRRLVQKLRRSLYWALAAGFLLMGVVAADVSISIAREWLNERLVQPG